MANRKEEEGISGGRFVPASNALLPPVRNYRIQRSVNIDYENAYHVGKISAGVGGIVQIRVNSNTYGMQVLWSSGSPVSPAPQIPVGENWELHVTYTITPDASTWTAAVTVVNTNAVVPANYRSQIIKDAYVSQTQTTDTQAFNMGEMPLSNVALRVKAWYTPRSGAGVEDPPSSEW